MDTIDGRVPSEPGNDELDQLRQWKQDTSLTLCELRGQLDRSRKALKGARGWLHQLCQQADRPDTSSVHSALAAVDDAIRLLEA